MSRFRRPTFVTPAIPKPPAAVNRVRAITTQITGLVSAIPKIPGLSLSGFNPNVALAQVKVQAVSRGQQLLVTKLAALPSIPAIPEGVQADLASVQAYQEALNSLLTGFSLPIDEFGRPLPLPRRRAEFPQAVDLSEPAYQPNPSATASDPVTAPTEVDVDTPVVNLELNTDDNLLLNDGGLLELNE